jgi:hypothetical protein
MVYLTPSKLISLLRMVYFKKKPEAEISSAFIKFQRELLGRGPQEAKTYIAQKYGHYQIPRCINKRGKASGKT